MKWISFLVFGLSLVIADTAEARRYHHRHHVVSHTQHVQQDTGWAATNPMFQGAVFQNPFQPAQFGTYSKKYLDKHPEATHLQRDSAVIGGRPPGCPHAFCGCGASLYKFGRIIPGLNVAWNWAVKFPRISPTEAGNGDAAVRHGHVAIVLANLGNGNYQLHDSNSGRGLTRIHVRHLVGYVFVRPSA